MSGCNCGGHCEPAPGGGGGDAGKSGRVETVQVLGTGCAKCQQLYQNTQQALSELGIDCAVEKVTELNDIMAMGVMMTPALAINGKVVLAGKAADVQQIKQLL